jgi:hypothetical protein
MASLFRPTNPADADSLAKFLKQFLSLPNPCPGYEAPDLTWKYWSPRGDWSGPRSYVLEGANGIEAHCGVLPVRLPSTREGSRAAHCIDWVADPRTFATGTRLMRKVAAVTGTLWAVGGSADTRTILPLLGFRPVNEARFFARPLRPFRQAVTHPRRGWKLPARVLRNCLWSFFPPVKAPAGWSVESIAPDRVPAEVWSAPASSAGTPKRTPQVYAYFLTCLFLRFELFVLRCNQQPVGGLLMGFCMGQARVADLWLMHESPEAYQAAYQLALVAALTDATAVEVIACASTAMRQEALRHCRFREYQRESIMVLSSDPVSPDGFDWQLLDNDAAFLTFGRRDYIT